MIDLEVDPREGFHHARIAQPPLHLVEHLLEFVQIQKERAQFATFQRGFGAAAVRDISSVRFSVARRIISL